MQKLIKNAIVYKAELPSPGAIQTHLEELPFAPIAETQLSRTGFVPNKTTGELVTTFPGGYSFTLRYDEKILPNAIVKAKADERIAEIEQRCGERLKKIERVAIAEQVKVDLAKTALVKTAIITCFYFAADSILIVPVSSKNLAGIIVGTLVHVVGSVKTQTIHISDIKNGLTTRLKSSLEGAADPFDGFGLGDQVDLKRVGEKVSYSLENLDAGKAGLLEALNSGFQVERLRLDRGETSFKLTSDFQFKSISFDTEAEHDEATDAAYAWRQEAAVQVRLMVDVVNRLCELFGYQEPDLAEAA